MRTLLAITAFLTFVSVASAGQVINGVSYNFNGTDWSVSDCNGTKTPLRCTLNGSDAPAGDAESDE